CTSAHKCHCDDGFEPVDCSGNACNSTLNNCPNSDTYWCAPSANLTGACDSPPADVSGGCQCADGRALFIPCGTYQSCEDWCRQCDPVNQDCTDPDRPKCAVIIDSAHGTDTRSCVADGTVALGGACSFSSDTMVDNCQKGGYCTPTIYSKASAPQICVAY